MIRVKEALRVRLHASNIALIENNGVAPDWGCDPFSNDSILFNDNSIISIIEELSQC